MKKHLFMLTMLLCILLSFAAFADEPPLACEQCGNTDLKWFTLISNGKDSHVRSCEHCYIMVGSIEPCIPLPGSATCTRPERCKVCGYAMTTNLSPDPDAHAWNAPQYTWNYLGDSAENELPQFACTAARTCKNRCGAKLTETVDATYTITVPSTCKSLGIVTYKASFAASWAETQVMDQAIVPLADHTSVTDKAVEPTCTKTGLTEGVHCSVCNKTLIEQDVIPAKDHSYKAKTIAPTCSKSGYTKHTCSGCGDTYTDSKTKARGHWYGPWSSNQDGTHSAECQRSSCDYKKATACTLYEVTLADAVLTVCPVCGDYKEAFFEVISESSISAVQRKALPRGEQIVYGMDAPCAGVLYAFTAAYEYAGKAEPFNGIVSVTIPLDAEKYTEFKLVRVDVTPATETAQRAEIQTDISFTFEDSKLTFETDTAGLFLLLPQQ